MCFREPDEGEDLGDAFLAFRRTARAVEEQRFGHDGADGLPRIERGEGVLEDDLHTAAEPAERRAAERA